MLNVYYCCMDGYLTIVIFKDSGVVLGFLKNAKPGCNRGGGQGRIPGLDKGANCVIFFPFFLVCYVNNCRSQMDFFSVFWDGEKLQKQNKTWPHVEVTERGCLVLLKWVCCRGESKFDALLPRDACELSKGAIFFFEWAKIKIQDFKNKIKHCYKGSRSEQFLSLCCKAGGFPFGLSFPHSSISYHHHHSVFRLPSLPPPPPVPKSQLFCQACLVSPMVLTCCWFIPPSHSPPPFHPTPPSPCLPPYLFFCSVFRQVSPPSKPNSSLLTRGRCSRECERPKILYLFCICIIIWDVFNYFDCWNKACEMIQIHQLFFRLFLSCKTGGVGCGGGGGWPGERGNTLPTPLPRCPHFKT